MADEPVTNVPYIGEKTAKTLRRKVRSFTNRGPIGDRVPTVDEATSIPEGVLQQELGMRQRQELGKYASGPFADENAFLTRDEMRKVSREQRDDGSTEPNETIRRGDFEVDRGLYKEGIDMHEERSAEAQRVDENRRARVTTDFSKWANNKDAFDFPGVDTPDQRRPRREEKDRGFVDVDKLLRGFESDDSDDDDGGVNIPGL